MTTRFECIKKSAGLAAITAMLTAAGLGLGSGIAQADPINPDPHDQVVTIVQRIHDRVSDRITRDLMFTSNQFNRHCERFDARLDRHFEGTLADRVTDHICGTM
jgi:hypothetical protein